jgi:dipeptidase E
LKPHIFLGGGGSEVQSRMLDEKFFACLKEGKLLYIPNALDNEKHIAAYSWFQGVVNLYSDIETVLFTNLSQKIDLEEICGVYIGGGNTQKLHNEVSQAKFDNKIRSILQAGYPVYGGSAGAIVLGNDIRTAPEVSVINGRDYNGLDILNGISVYCHYSKEQFEKVRSLSHTLQTPIIAIPEDSGVEFSYQGAFIHGESEVDFFKNNETDIIKPGKTFKL